MKKILSIAAVLTGLLLAGPITVSWTQNAADDVAEDILYSYGSVVSVDGGVLVVTEYDFEKDQEIEIQYMLNDETEFENFSQWQDLKAADEIEILFKEDGADKMAVMISKDEGLGDEMDMGEGMEEGMDEVVEEGMEAAMPEEMQMPAEGAAQ